MCSGGEGCLTCQTDCGICDDVCGDDVCGFTETCTTCLADCDVCTTCGNNQCEELEDCASCATDCGSCPAGCGDALCQGALAESCQTCAPDCGGCAGQVLIAFDRIETQGGAWIDPSFIYGGDASTNLDSRNACTGSRSIRLRHSTGYAERTLNTAGYTNLSLTFCARTQRFSGTDRADVLVNGSVVTTINDLDNLGCQCRTVPIADAATQTIAFDAGMNRKQDRVFIDNVEIRGQLVPGCGDGLCSDTEGCGSCPQDCGACTSPLIAWDHFEAAGGAWVQPAFTFTGTAQSLITTRACSSPRAVQMTGGTGRATRTVTTAGYADLELSFCSRTENFDNADRAFVEVDGVAVATITDRDGQGCGCQTVSLPSGASKQIVLRGAMNQSSDRVFFDAVEVSGTPSVVCGDGSCGGTETCLSCSGDCGLCPEVCGNGTCAGLETCSSCARDCGVCPAVCGDGTCATTESCASCSGDCGACPPTTLATDYFESSTGAWVQPAFQLTGDALIQTGSSNACSGTRSLRLRTSTGLARRTVTTSGYTNLMVNYCVRTTGFSGGDRAFVQIDGATVHTISSLNNQGCSCRSIPVANAASVQIGFRAGMNATSDQVFFDNVTVTGVPAVNCGDGTCQITETCALCPGDCGVCPAACADGTCNATETCGSCASDCGTCPETCGNGTCHPTESCATCAADCGTCPTVCGDDVCTTGETCATCAADCGQCPPVCGDLRCNGTETCVTCPGDCGTCAPYCGDASCNGGETCGTCAKDCGACPPRCGDNICNAGETCTSCSADCGACPSPCPGGNCDCGDGTCGAGESCASCATDCGACPRCGDGSCLGSESCATCPGDCGACPGCGDDACLGTEYCATCADDCGTCATANCGDGICGTAESCATCAEDCCSGGACGHDRCTTGSPLAAACDPCAAIVCTLAPGCCTTRWDAICVGLAAAQCGASCASTGLACGDGVCGPDESCLTCSTDCTCVSGCGDGTCRPGETCTSCPSDCGACPTCGDGTCALAESCASCAADCGTCTNVCGDGACDPTESCTTCAADCNACPTCGDTVCSVSESCTTCPGDCGACPIVCGDGTCNGSESCSSCIADCGACAPGCGNGTCAAPETCGSCPLDCGACPSTCGDLMCTGVENCLSCPGDCGRCTSTCGNQSCEAFAGETCASCAPDCGTCAPLPHVLCRQGLPIAKLSHPCAAKVCGIDPFCCAGGWDEACVAEVTSACGLSCATCGNGTCDPGEDCATCADCGSCPASCGDGLCSAFESCGSCPIDCGPCAACGNGICEYFAGEVCGGCMADCGSCGPTCGDGVCSGTETCSDCPTDCGPCAKVCGDGMCDVYRGESCASCSADCGTCASSCGDARCTANESTCTCASDCGACPCAHAMCTTGAPLGWTCDPCVSQICEVDPYCCTNGWDETCVWDVFQVCGLTCEGACGNGTCDFRQGESCSSCSDDCGTCAGP